MIRIMQEDNPIAPQEQIIYEIVEDILRTEDKIAELTESLNLNDNNSTLNNELMTLRNEKSNYTQYIKDLQDELAEKLLPNQKLIDKRETEVTKLNRKIAQLESQLKHLSASAKGNVYLMSYEKIEDMINSKKNNDDIKMIDQEIASSESLRLTIESSIAENKSKQSELMESLRMLKEDKEVNKNEVINLISQKESIEEIIKVYTQQTQFNTKLNTNTNANNHTNVNTKEIDLSYYEIAKADTNRVVSELSKILIDKPPINQGTIVNGTLFNVQTLYMNNSIKNLILEYINQSSHHSQQNSIEAFIQRLSNQLIKIIKSSQIALDELTITDDTYEITKEIQLPIDDYYNEEEMCLHIKYIFKALYYDKNIKQILTFISKDYKSIKKSIEKQINHIKNTITKLVTRREEIDNKLIEMKNKKRYLIDNSKPKEMVELSIEEKEYIKQNELLTVLKKDKEDIEAEIESIEYGNNEIKDEYDRKMIHKKEEERILGVKIDQLTQAIKNEQLEINNTIIRLRKQIAEKYIIIKSQLKIYRENNGNNLFLYNKLVDSINCTIRSTSSSKNQLNTERSLYSSPSQGDATRTNINISAFHRKNYLSHSSSMANVYSLRDSRQRENTISLNSQDISYQEKITHSTKKKQTASKSPSKCIKGNDQTTIWLKERDKLNRTIKNLKEKITKAENVFDKNAIAKQLKPLNHFTPCYSRFVCSKEKKFNPLHDSVSNVKEFAFIKAAIALDELFCDLLIKNNQNEIKTIPLESISNTIVSTVMKHIIQIFRESRRTKSMMSTEDINNKEEFAMIPLTSSEKAKAALNTHFNFSIQFKKDQRIEFVFSSYEDFKLWLNALAYVIKNRSAMNKYHSLQK